MPQGLTPYQQFIMQMLNMGQGAFGTTSPEPSGVSGAAGSQQDNPFVSPPPDPSQMTNEQLKLYAQYIGAVPEQGPQGQGTPANPNLTNAIRQYWANFVSGAPPPAQYTAPSTGTEQLSAPATSGSTAGYPFQYGSGTVEPPSLPGNYFGAADPIPNIPHDPSFSVPSDIYGTIPGGISADTSPNAPSTFSPTEFGGGETPPGNFGLSSSLPTQYPNLQYLNQSVDVGGGSTGGGENVPSDVLGGGSGSGFYPGLAPNPFYPSPIDMTVPFLDATAGSVPAGGGGDITGIGGGIAPVPFTPGGWEDTTPTNVATQGATTPDVLPASLYDPFTGATTTGATVPDLNVPTGSASVTGPQGWDAPTNYPNLLNIARNLGNTISGGFQPPPAGYDPFGGLPPGFLEQRPGIGEFGAPQFYDPSQYPEGITGPQWVMGDIFGTTTPGSSPGSVQAPSGGGPAGSISPNLGNVGSLLGNEMLMHLLKFGMMPTNAFGQQIGTWTPQLLNLFRQAVASQGGQIYPAADPGLMPDAGGTQPGGGERASRLPPTSTK